MPKTFDEAWLLLLEKININGAIESPRGLRTKEILCNQLNFDMNYPILTIDNRQLGYKFLCAEAWWILNGTNRVDLIEPYSKMIPKFSDDGISFRGAYGPKIMDQIPYIAETLIKDPASRQAVLTIWRERPGPTKDVPCTVAAQWFLRQEEGKIRLHCSVTMRSSDAWLGVPYDCFNFSMISAFIICYIHKAREKLEPELAKTCPESIELGTMYFTAGSQHLYEQHWEAAKDCVFAGKSSFDYKPASNQQWSAIAPYELVDHLKALADLDPDEVKTDLFLELLDIKKGKNRDDAEGKPRGYN